MSQSHWTRDEAISLAASVFYLLLLFGLCLLLLTSSGRVG